MQVGRIAVLESVHANGLFDACFLHSASSGFWFTLTTAWYEEWPIDTVVVINLTPDNYSLLVQELAENLAEGWISSD
jgi:hypothetical protein